MHAFEKIIPLISERLQVEGSAILVGSRGRIPIKKEAFQSLTAKQGPSFLFVDGGNGEILKGPNVSIQFVRLYATKYEDNVRVKTWLEELFVVVLAEKKGLDIAYSASVFNYEGDKLRSFSFDAFDPVLCAGGRRATPTSVSLHVRKMLEVLFAIERCKDAGDVLVRDGDLDKAGMGDEMRTLQETAKTHNVSLLGLSKTSALCTDAGNSALVVLRRLAPKGSWVYDAGGSVLFVKLHPSSRYVFRCDVSERVSNDVFAALAANSVDPAFLGYPYGLLDADKFAQVTKDECAQMKARFAVKSKDVFRSVEAALNAHDILDSL